MQQTEAACTHCHWLQQLLLMNIFEHIQQHDNEPKTMHARNLADFVLVI